MGRKETIIKKYGSLENYEKLRAIKTREAMFKKCTSPEELEKKKATYAYFDMLKARELDYSLLGKEYKCETCGKIFIVNKNRQPYCRSCLLNERHISNFGSIELARKSAEINRKKNCLKKYNDANYNNRDRSKETCKKLYGGNSPLSSQEVRDKAKETKIQKYGDENFSNIEKRKSTCLKKYGVDCVFKNKEIYDKTNRTKLKKYGNKNNFEKIKNTKKIKYNDEFYTNKEKSKSTCLLKYGVQYPYQNKEILEKVKQSTYSHYGVDNISKTEKRRQELSKSMKEKDTREFIDYALQKELEKYGSFNIPCRYEYDNKIFDSSWELAYYIYLRDNNINFIYKPEKISYLDDKGKKHYYFPDFFTDHFVEIKSPSLLLDDGTLCDFNRIPNFEKTKLLKDNNTEIISTKEIAPILTFVENKYGKTFLKSCKITRGKDAKN